MKKPAKPAQPNQPSQPKAPRSILMPDELRSQIAGLDQQIAGAKIAYATQALELRRMEAEIADLHQLLLRKVAAFAAAHGIDAADPSKGRWHFDMAQGTLTAVE
jgi:hypothetical protein